MEAVSLESLPPEDSDLYIPNLSGVHTQSSSPPSGEAALQLSTIRYTPSAPAAAPAVLPPPLVAAQTPGSLIQGIYRTTFTTQVIAAQTFHYPPTPPIDGHVQGTDRGEKHHLQQVCVDNQVLPSITQNVIENELPVSAGLEKTVNPFPSPLPTPPDMESLHQSGVLSQQQHRNGDDQQMQQTSIAKMVLPTSSGHQQQQWAAQQTSNICFMPPTAASCGGPLVPYSCNNGAGVSAIKGPVPALQQMCYSAAVSNPLAFNDPRYVGSSNTFVGEVLRKIPTIPALVKDGKKFA